MAKAGAPLGNKNATKNRPITEAITRALLANDGEKLRAVAEAIVNRAIMQSDQAASHVLDRVEGKVAQPISGDPENPVIVQVNKLTRGK